PQIGWVYVDLGEVTPVSIIKILWETAMSSDYTIDVSDDAENWTTVYTVSGNADVENLFQLDETVNARYVRVNNNVKATEWGVSIFELEIYSE
nr:discoidin domain-containing protein [Spirochaetaceae bacterium]